MLWSIQCLSTFYPHAGKARFYCFTLSVFLTSRYPSLVYSVWLWYFQVILNVCLYKLGFKPSSKIFYWPFQGGTSFVDLLCFCSVLCLLCLCASVYMCFVVTCWERADLLALVCGVFCEFVTFPLVSWVRCGTWLYRFLIFAPLLTFIT